MTEWRYPSLEGLRFLASLAIVVYHFVPYTERGLAAPEFWSGQFSVAVDLFFVISGIVIANGYLGRTSTWRECAGGLHGSTRSIWRHSGSMCWSAPPQR
jgi:peptidoglycan/LPS O-acetylase OafA/YrhL